MAFKNVILADDDMIMLEGLKALLAANAFPVTALASSFDELDQLLKTQTCDVLICDCRMPGEGPANLLKRVKRFLPDTKVIFLTGLQSGLLFKHLADQDVDGLVSKKDGVYCLVEALQAITKQQRFFSPTIQNCLNTAICNLTPKEAQVFELIINGYSNPEIADRLSNSPSTIGRHRENLMQKLEANSVVDLMRIASENGMLES